MNYKKLGWPSLEKIRNEPVFYEISFELLTKEFGGFNYAEEFVKTLIELYENYQKMSEWQLKHRYQPLVQNLSTALKYPHAVSLRGCHDEAILFWRELKL